MNTRWTLITVTWNSEMALRMFWSPPPENVEWIVVDNASTDRSVDFARMLGASRVIGLDKNLGFGAANNLGFEVASSDFVGFVNPDVRVDYSQLGPLSEAIAVHNGISSPQLVNADGTPQANGRGMPTLLNKIRNRTVATPGVDDRYTYYALDGRARYVTWLMGAVILGRASVIREIGGWDEDFFVYYEDSDLGVRSWANGVPVVLDGRFKWVHGWARETRSLRLRPWILELRAMSTFYRKYPEFLVRTKNIGVRHAQALAHLGEYLKEDQ